MENRPVISQRGLLVGAVRLLFVLLVLITSGCSLSTPDAVGDTSPTTEESTHTQSAPTTNVTPTETEVPPTASPSQSPSPTSTSTSTPTVTETSTPTDTATSTPPPPTPSGEDAIYFYGIMDQADDPKKCEYIAVRINTGKWRSGDVAADVKTALNSLLVKRQYYGALSSPVYLSNISVQSVSFKPFTGEVSIRLTGTYVRSGETCDDGKVRAQIWSTIRQFPEIKTIDILLNGNLLGDILAPGRK